MGLAGFMLKKIDPNAPVLTREERAAGVTSWGDVHVRSEASNVAQEYMSDGLDNWVVDATAPIVRKPATATVLANARLQNQPGVGGYGTKPLDTRKGTMIAKASGFLAKEGVKGRGTNAARIINTFKDLWNTYRVYTKKGSKRALYGLARKAVYNFTQDQKLMGASEARSWLGYVTKKSNSRDAFRRKLRAY